ncbi:hypothetical protein HU200_008047 [Digitaria exilis]|uniref:PGG domain-containing protein n=1 Tax=Digitaria exilis TaxID=1010633 RepID=A0A835KQM6_9POAL|nr:hypothetical protein HU200_008047 [Digitaria exilis]
MARHLIDKTNGNLSCSGPDGRNLTMQRDKDGSTPLHLAASLDWWPQSWILSERFQDIWPWSKPTATMLLDANICSAYQPDNKGLYPIHIAALADNLDVTKVLLQKCPDCATLQDGEGRTFLHVAAGGGSRRNWIYKVAHHKLSTVLNVQDNNGDTALHCAIHAGNLAAFHCLVRNPQVDLNVPNKDDLTPLGLSWSKIPQSLYYKLHPRAMMSSTLVLVGAAAGGSRSDLFDEKYICEEIDEAKKSEDLAKLIATVTFAAAFTLPGGYYQSTSDGGVPGTPILAGSYAFSAFILADALSFILSCLATFYLVFAGMPAMELSVRYKYINVSSRFLLTSEGSLMASFALGLYLVLAPIAHDLAVMICITSSVALVFGCMETLRLLFGVNTVRARLGIRGLAAWCDLARTAGFSELLPFTSLIAIFGLPAIMGKENTRLLIAELIFLFLFVVFLSPPYIRWKVKRWKI